MTMDTTASGSKVSSSRSLHEEPELVMITGPTADIAGLRIGIRQAGPVDAVPIVCMHGIGSNAGGYRAQLADLSDTFRVIAWDAPGYGRSDPLPWSEPRPESYADALVGLIEALRLAPTVLVGSSFGAVIAAAFAVRYPGLVRGVVLSAPAAGFARTPAAERKAVLDKRINDMERLGPAELAVQRAPALVAPTSPDNVVQAAVALVAAVNPPGYYQAAHAIDMADTITVAEQIDCPTLVVVGSEDRVTPAATCARPIHAALKHGRLEVVEGIGHLVKLEAPERFNALVRDFVTSLGRN
jgi:pimeloyl-ACP methyl ester carboxylesterase